MNYELPINFGGRYTYEYQETMYRFSRFLKWGLIKAIRNQVINFIERYSKPLLNIRRHLIQA